MRKFLIVLFCGLLGIFLVSCTNSTTPKVTLELAIWGNIKEVKIIEDSIKIFNQKYPDVKVVISHSPQGQQYIEKLLTRAASASMPDIMFSEVNFINKFIDKDMLMDISALIKNDKTISINDYFPEIINRFKNGDKLYGLPRDVAPFACIFYNKNLFEQEGIKYPNDNWTTYDFLNIAKRLTKKDQTGNITQYGFYTWVWQNFVYCFGGQLVDNIQNPKKCVLNSRNAIAGITFYKDLIYKYNVMPAPGTVEMGFNEMFMTGKIAMYGSGIWETPVLRDIKSFKWDIVMFPKGPNGKRGFATGGSGYSIARTTKHPELAYELLKVLSGEYGQTQLAKDGLAQPALRKLAEGEIWAKDYSNPPANKGMLNVAVHYIIFNPFIPQWGELEQKYIGPIIDLIVRNQKDVTQGLNEVVKNINNSIKK